MTDSNPGTIDALLQEDRRFPPPPEFAAAARANDESIYQRADENPEAFWAEQARTIDFFRPYDQVLEWNAPAVKWFAGGELNACYNCVDRHITGPRKNKAALVWEGEPGDDRVLTYWDLYREVNRAAAALRDLGVKKGDRVAVYMPMIPELPITLLACARLGAPHSVVFGGFSPHALRDRINDCGAKVLITADGGFRRGAVVPLKDNADAAVAECPTIEKVLVVQRVGPQKRQVAMREGRDVWWHDAVTNAPWRVVPPEPVDSEHPLFILYTSGTTGKPKGVLHTTAGYLLGTSTTHRLVFDLREEDVYFCTADIGWVTGHSYIVYGPLANGATSLMYEGAPDFPDKDRMWAIVEKYGVSIYYTAPTAIRAHMRWGDEFPKQRDKSTLRLLGTVGEPINPEAWMWYYNNIGEGRCPVVDTWWQTETGMILITPLPGLVTLKPGSATRTFPGVAAAVLDEAGNEVPPNVGGNLVLTRPWPAMMRTIYGDDERYKRQYWSTYPGKYLTGDGCRRDNDGYFWLLGRVDDVVNVAGHRIGTMEVESALVSHPAVAEAAVIGIADELKGQALAAFVTPRSGVETSDKLMQELRQHVAKEIGPIARPDKIFFTAELPKTRSAKIMRRLLRDIAEGRVVGDTTTLTDVSVLTEIRRQYEEKEG